jgi:hypothetical protein
MVPIPSLWLPILLSAVVVFIASTIMHMLLPYHRKDHGPVPNEDGVMEALRKFDIPPGDYMIPCAGSPDAMKQPAFQEKMKKGPVVVLTVMPCGATSMTASLVQWFLYLVLVGILVAYITGHAVAPGGRYLAVFRFAGATAFIAYAIALWQNSIWFKLSWSTTLKNTIDGLVYGVVTAGIFGWLWPR